MTFTKLTAVCLILLGACFVVGCGRQVVTDTLIEEINAAGARAKALTNQADAKSQEVFLKRATGNREERQKLIDEAANLYGQIADLLNQSADKCDQVVKITTTDWYKDYFTAYSKWTRNLAKIARSAQEELLLRKTGVPSQDQVKLWKESYDKLHKENEELRNQIIKIETEHKTVLVKRE